MQNGFLTTEDKGERQKQLKLTLINLTIHWHQHKSK